MSFFVHLFFGLRFPFNTETLIIAGLLKPPQSALVNRFNFAFISQPYMGLSKPQVLNSIIPIGKHK